MWRGSRFRYRYLSQIDSRAIQNSRVLSDRTSAQKCVGQADQRFPYPFWLSFALPNCQLPQMSKVHIVTGKLLKQVVAGGFYNKWMANAFKTNGWPMLLKYVEANAFNTSRAYNESPIWGRRPKAAPIICSSSIKSIGHRSFLTALTTHLFEKDWPSTYYKSQQFLKPPWSKALATVLRLKKVSSS